MLFEYFEALELAAQAGDIETQYLLANEYKELWISKWLNPEKFYIYEIDYYNAELAYLMSSVSAHHPEAQKMLGKYLISGRHPKLGYKPIQGIKEWLAGCIGVTLQNMRPKLKLNERLLKLSNSSVQVEFSTLSGRTKFSYRGNGVNQVAKCGIRYAKIGECDHIFIEQLPNLSNPSIKNAIARIATKILYSSLLSGLKLEPERIIWYEVFPSEPLIFNSGSVMRIEFDWNGTIYHSPKWAKTLSKNEIPIDLSDILHWAK